MSNSTDGTSTTEKSPKMQMEKPDDGLNLPSVSPCPTGVQSNPSPAHIFDEVSDRAIPTSSRLTPRPASPRYTPSILTSRDFQTQNTDEINDIKCEIMASWLHSKQEEKLWTSGGEGEGVVLKRSRGMYTCAPLDLGDHEDDLFDAVQALNVKVAMTVNTRVIQILLQRNSMPYIEIRHGLRVQVLPDISYLPRCQKHQFAAFIADAGILIVWDDEPDKIVDRIEQLESALVRMIWGGESTTDPGQQEKRERAPSNVSGAEGKDLEALAEEKPRRVVLMQSYLTAATLILTISAIAAGWRLVAIEIAVDKYFLRVLFILAFLPQAWLGLFFFQALVGNVAQIIGPISQMNENTKYYSGIAPCRLQRENGDLPHVTIQCPVYKEGLRSVIEPTIRSIKNAISTYEMQGGTANIFVNDDGMQLISDANARERQEFYEEHNIGWVARPKHNPKPAPGEKVFLRRGKFKKASNMNYALWVSQRVEEKLEKVGTPVDWSQDQEALVYENALSEVIAEDEGQIWAEGNIRMGDYILLIDSDTRVPSDCLLDAVSEMEQSPRVAIMQYSSGVMNVTDSFFERGITFFTNLIYTQIRYAVANGDVAPFVGHNAILRWAAVQEIAYDCPLDGREKYWSEATVSEDFDMALRLQTFGYLVRLATYTGDGFKEGVSLTVYDELARWEKYAYGCNELIFHPVKQWLTKGPITPLFHNFLFSNMPFPSKITILAYIGTYYALGSSWILTLMNYFVVGWFNGWFDHYYLDSFKIFFAIIIVFTALGNVSLAALRYRSGEHSLFPSLIENLKWIPLLIIFLGGVSLHVSQALLSHMFGIDMSWGATSKEAENVSFFEEIPRVVRRFKGTFVACIVLTGLMVAMALAVPDMWQIDFLVAVFPLAMVVFSHFMLPIALNPNLMLFTW